MQQHAETMRAGHLAHQRHDQHVMVYRQVALLEDRSKLELVRCHLVVACLHRDAQFQGLYLQVLHESGHTGRDGSEIMVFQLLVLRRFMPHQRTPGQQQVRTGGIQAFVHQKVFLLPSQIRNHLLHGRVEVMAHLYRRLIHRTQSLQQRRLVVERLAGISDEHGGDAQRVVYHEYGRRGIPSTVTARLERVPYAPVGKGRGIGFLLHEQLARKFLHHPAFAVVFHESVMLLCRAFRQRLEPVGIVRHPQFFGPTLHARSHPVGHAAVQNGTMIHGIHQPRIYGTGQILEHLLAAEHIFAEIFTGPFRRDGHFFRLRVESTLYNSES